MQSRTVAAPWPKAIQPLDQNDDLVWVLTKMSFSEIFIRLVLCSLRYGNESRNKGFYVFAFTEPDARNIVDALEESEIYLAEDLGPSERGITRRVFLKKMR